MYTELVKIMEAGLNSDPDRVRSYAELFVAKHYIGDTGVKFTECTMEEKLASSFKNILEGNINMNTVTLDS